MAYSETLALELDSTDNSNSYAEIIATVVSSLKEDAAYESHGEGQGHTWKFNYGTVQVFVHLTGESPDDTLSVWSPVLSLPARDEAKLCRGLLEKSWIETLEARFSIWNDQVVLNHFRTLEGITAAEISRAITIVATLADEYDEPLLEEFGNPQ
jgi:hypothetical protein